MWCPTEVKRLTSIQQRQNERDAALFTQEFLDRINLQKQTLQ